MITQIQATNSQGSVLGLPLYDVSNGYVVEEVEGLDPVKATLVSSSFAELDGTQHQSARREDRNIKLKIGLEADFVENTVASLRKGLYRFFMPKSFVKLVFIDDDDEEYQISGYVETCEAPLFTDEPVMDVSIICNDPDFYDSDVVTINGATVSSTATTDVNYDGSVETGVQITINVNRAVAALSIYNTLPDGTLQQLDFNKSDLVNGDIVKINTIPGSKSVVVTHSGADTSALYGMTPQSNWIELQPGLNQLRIYAAGAAIPYSIVYTTKYGGL